MDQKRWRNYVFSSIFLTGKCQPGTYSKSGVEPCLPCPKGTYQPLVGGDKCSQCPGLTTTAGLGTISSANCFGKIHIYTVSLILCLFEVPFKFGQILTDWLNNMLLLKYLF